MYGIIKSVYMFFKLQPLYSSSLIILGLIVCATQYQYWFGNYSNHDLEILQKEIVLVEVETEAIRKKNEELNREKEKLNSGKQALEGVARSELGMIRPGETFYVFKDALDEDLKDN